MSCPDWVKLGSSITFSCTTRTPGGIPYDASSGPYYSVYESGSDVAMGELLNLAMTKLDDDNTTGVYNATIVCLTANGFEQNKTYTIVIEATVFGQEGNKSYSFLVV